MQPLVGCDTRLGAAAQLDPTDRQRGRSTPSEARRRLGRRRGGGSCAIWVEGTPSLRDVAKVTESLAGASSRRGDGGKPPPVDVTSATTCVRFRLLSVHRRGCADADRIVQRREHVPACQGTQPGHLGRKVGPHWRSTRRSEGHQGTSRTTTRPTKLLDAWVRRAACTNGALPARRHDPTSVSANASATPRRDAADISAIASTKTVRGSSSHWK